jgi:hypothetical protein
MRLLLLLLSAAQLVGAPGEALKTNTVTLAWEASPPTELIEAYRLYYRTSLPPGMPVTNAPAGGVMQWTPPATNGWALLSTIAPTTNQVTLPRLPGVMFFVLTASNRLGESPFSNVAWTPAPPDHRDRNLQITAEH